MHNLFFNRYQNNQKCFIKIFGSNIKLQLSYDSGGDNVQYEDKTILNYRKSEAWEMIIDEVKYNIF